MHFQLNFNFLLHIFVFGFYFPKKKILGLNRPSKVEFIFPDLRWLNTALAVSEYRSFSKLWQEKGCSSQAETWQVKNILMKDFD